MSQSWIDREFNRQNSGERTLPVWEREEFWYSRRDETRRHFVHVSASDRSLLAYTQDDDKGERDIQTPIKPGRYLTRYFSDVLTAKQIAFFASWQVTGKRESAFANEAGYPLAFADEPADIVRVYQNGPTSCMGPHHFTDREHPCAVYGAGDLAIAYLTRAGDDKIIARALCFPEKKVVGRIYPTPDCWLQDKFDSYAEALDCQNVLLQRLRALGYQSTYESETATFNGARLIKQEGRNGGHVMPYLDQGYMVNDSNDGEHWIIAKHGDYECANTDGTLDNESDYSSCDRCGDRLGAHDATFTVYTGTGGGAYARGEQSWCQDCHNNHTFFCEGISETFSDDDVCHSYVNGSDYCDRWLQNNAFQSDRDGDWYFSDDDGPVTMANGETWAQSELDDHGFTCRITGENYPSDEMHTDHRDVWEGVDDDDLREAGLIDDDQPADLAA